MIQIKSKSRFLVFPLMASLWVFMTGGNTEDPFIEFLKVQFSKYYTNHLIERTFLMTDRFVYRPGEDLWFKGFVTSADSEHAVNSQDFFIRLLNDRGEEIVYRRYPLSGNETSGRLLIPRSCIPGKYWLVAYSSWMKNRCPQEAFRKQILISKYFERRFIVETLYDRISYKPGDTLSAQIRILDPAGKPVAETFYDFTAGTLSKTDVKGNGKTDIKGKSKIQFIVPEGDELLMFTVEIRGRRFSGDFTSLIPTSAGKTIVTFFPEGGHLVRGLKSKTGFRVTDQYGIPRYIRGVLTDGSGRILDTVSCSQTGMGIFEYTPPNDSVYLSILYPEGINEKFVLPVANAEGNVIRYEGQHNNTVDFSIISTARLIQKSYWTAVLNGRLIWANAENFAGAGRISIPVGGSGSGIMQVTVFDQDYNIMAQRNVRIEDQQEDLRVRMERETYKSRQRVSLLVEFPPNLIRENVALSVAVENLTAQPGMPDFKEIINSNPCASEYPETLAEGEDLLISEFLPVNWNEILIEAGSRITYTNQDGLNGVVYDKKENISPHAKVRITHFPNLRLYETQTDENGLFRVSFGSEIIDYRFLNIDAYDALGKTSLNAKIDYSYIEELREILANRNSRNDREKITDVARYGEPDLVYDLRYGPGKFRKSRSDTRKKFDPYQYANYTDVMDILQDLQSYTLVDNRIIFNTKTRGDSAGMPEAILVVNGALKGTNVDALKNIIPSDITNINISGSLLDIRKYTPLNFSSVIEITTIQGMSRYRQDHVQTAQGILNPYREFYSPDYAVESSYSADNRKTLYWNPKIPLYQGNSMVVTFYTSDVKGTFLGHITGLDNKGNPVEKTFRFRVE